MMIDKTGNIKPTASNSILVVDDLPDNLRLLASMLTEHGYKVRTAPSGDRALATIQKELPDLILLDIMMPVMNGYEVCRRLKRDSKTREIPILFISALDEVADKVKGFSLGGLDYITKPFYLEEVLARVQTHLTLRKLQREFKDKNAHLQQTNDKLQRALEEIKILRGILPICANCKKIRDDKGYWNQIESYIHKHSEAEFSHSICPDCAKKLYPNLGYNEKDK